VPATLYFFIRHDERRKRNIQQNCGAGFRAHRKVKDMKKDIRIARDIKDRGVVIIKKLTCDTLTPVGAYSAIVGDEDGFLLESLPGSYSFLGRFDKDSIVSVLEHDDPWSLAPVREMLEFENNGLPPFIGGYLGYIGYDMVRGIEVLPRPAKPSGFPDAMLGKVHTVVIFNHLAQEMSLLHTIPEPGISDEEALNRSAAEFDNIESSLYLLKSKPFDLPGPCHIVEASISEKGFIDAVKNAKQHILDGDIIQVVLSRRLKLDANCETFDTYRRLRRINPSTYMFYMKMGEVTLIGSSPEVMVELKGSEIMTLPIAGTRPRGRTSEEDEKLVQELLADEKERAEHLMLLDLARNDVGRVAKPGTVKVDYQYKIKYYSHVMHIVSCVKGEKLENMSNVDVLKACFPAGTVSGAPKVRAMEIIDELEGMCRGPYAGAAGYLSYNGNMDTGIAIRTIFVKNGQYYVQAGAGIVWDSVPENELKEIENKLKGLSVALGGIS
jgi:anthranilate synthase component 1